MKLFNSKLFYDYYLERIFISILLFYVFNSFLMKSFAFFYKVNLILPILAFLKFLFLFFYLIVLIINFKKRRRIFIYLGFLFLVFAAGNFEWDLKAISNYFSYPLVWKMNFSFFIKYLYPFIFIGVFSLIKNKQESITHYFEILEKLLLVNVVFVFLGFLFSIDLLQSYMHSSRFGYSGLIERGFFLYLLIIVISRRFFLNKLDFKFVILCLASLFIGIKSVILFFGVLMFYFLYEKRKIKLLFFYTGLIVSILVFIKPIVDFFAIFFPFWQPILKKHGYLTMITSTRNLSVENTIEYVKINGTLKNLFFGGLDYSGHFVEIDFMDLFLLFGIFGTIIYMMFLSRIINKKHHLIPFIVAFFFGDFLFSTIIISTCFIWMYESYSEQKDGVLSVNDN